MKETHKTESDRLHRGTWILRFGEATGAPEIVEIIAPKTETSRAGKRRSTFSMPTDNPIVDKLQKFAEGHDLPDLILCDNSLEFHSYSLKRWASMNEVEIRYEAEGSPRYSPGSRIGIRRA
jgi:hypothetical protein